MPSFKSLILLTAAALAEVHTVEVGEKGLVISPNNFKAAVGDTVIFKLYEKHDIAQSPFDKPCNPLNGGIYSGPYSDTDGGKKKFVMNVTTTDPIWYYCSTPTHCINGMVGGINLPTDGNQTVQAYKDASAKASGQTSPQKIFGGTLLTDDQIAALNSNTTATPSKTPTGSALLPSGTSVSSGVPASSGAPVSETPAPSGTRAPQASSSAGDTTGPATPDPTNAAGKMGVNMGLAAAIGALAFSL